MTATRNRNNPVSIDAVAPTSSAFMGIYLHLAPKQLSFTSHILFAYPECKILLKAILLTPKIHYCQALFYYHSQLYKENQETRSNESRASYNT